ncbi:hypothetical protein ACS0PU_003579 [Formica fusca]
MKTTYFVAFIVVVATLSVAESGVYSQNSRQSYKTEHNYHGSNYDGAPAKYYKNQNLAETAASTSASDSLPARKPGVSAWGIIAIILGIIILSTITYYIFILYPYICKRDQTYDIIELTEVNSVCTVSDNTNNMPLYRSSNDALNDISNNVSLNQ